MFHNHGRTQQKVVAGRWLFGLTVILILCGPAARAHSSPQGRGGATELDISVTRTQVATLLDAFVKAAAATGHTCSIAKPKIVVEDVPSYGSYDAVTNTLTTPAWEQLTKPERALFYHFLGPQASEAAAHTEFETAAHHWILIHELGHWWQACSGVVEANNHYAIELGADRIAAAYWRERDASLIAHQRVVFESILRHFPNPVPPGQNAETFFNENYEKLGPTPAYIWFQARMCMAALDEKPTPGFAETLK